MTGSVNTPFFKAILVDDHALFLEGFAELIKKLFPNSVLDNFTSVEKAKEQLSIRQYEVLLIDLYMPGFDAKQFIINCKKKYPRMAIMVVSSIIEIGIIKEYLNIGVNAYISKVVTSGELRTALEKVFKGEKYLSSDLGGTLAANLFAEEKSGLTAKELEMLRLIAAGHTVDKAAKILKISPYTVLAHRRNIMKKLELHSAAELVKYAYTNKLH